MKNTIKNAYSACAGVSDSGWYGGMLVLPGRDKEFVKVPKVLSYEQRAEHARRWSELTVNPRREIALVRPRDTGMASRCIAAAERLEGPVAPREQVATPTLVWIERRAGQWRLVVFENNEVRTIVSRNDVMRCPRVALTLRGFLFAFESDTGPHTTQTEVVDSKGVTLYQTAGRAPLLCAAGDGFVLGTEQSTPNEVTLRFEHVPGDALQECGPRAKSERSSQRLARTLALQSTADDLCSSNGGRASPRAGLGAVHGDVLNLREGDFLFNADMAWSEEEGSLFVTAESSPKFGYSNQIGLHRTVHTWQWEPGKDPVSLGALPVERRAFKSIGAENMAPIQSTVLIDDGQPVVVFKQHRFTGFRAFGWDLLWCHRDGDNWTEPVRISPETTTSDSTFGLVLRDGMYIGLFPSHENEGGKGSKQSEGHQVDLVTFNRDCRLDRFEIPDEKKAEYRIPSPCENVALEPEPLISPYEGRQLIWGDLHIHTTYSKCVPAVDSGPRENIRFAREVLGCRVFAIAEHTPHTTGIESTWLYDQLESTAGKDNVILYASEPGIKGTRHMNLYSRDRETFEKLERILIAHDHHYPDVLRQMREDLPHDSIFVMRHVHGDAIPDEQIPQHFDPHFEVAMEAMQGRGNAMLEEVETSAVFPNSFLDAGCKVGLVGGTDHFREWAPNHFCLTGFWVKEVSADGVWEAIRNRYTIAMSDSRVAMVTRCKGAPMGENVTLGVGEPMQVNVQASCGHSIRRITLMRDGELLPWTDVGATSVALELVDEGVTPGTHWYVVTAEVNTGHGVDNIGICHASPYFVWKER